MKNRKALALGGLLMAVAVTAYSVSGTYAKYISKVGGTDTARVARWSFNSDAQEIDLFKESYKDGAVKSLMNCDAEGKNCDNVVAPGTEGKYTFQLTTDNLDLASEVRYKFTVNIKGTDTARVGADTTSPADGVNSDAQNLMLEGKTVGNDYSPIKFYLSDDDTLTADTINKGIEDNTLTGSWLSIEELETALKTIYGPLVDNGTDKVRDPEEQVIEAMTTGALKKYTIYWKWDFTDIPALADDKSNQYAVDTATLISKYDTKLGNEAAKNPESKKVTLTVEFIAEQVAN